MKICRGALGRRRATKSIRSCELRTRILLVEGRVLLCGSDDAKFHSSSSAEACDVAACGGEGVLTSAARSSSADEDIPPAWLGPVGG